MCRYCDLKSQGQGWQRQQVRDTGSCSQQDHVFITHKGVSHQVGVGATIRSAQVEGVGKTRQKRMGNVGTGWQVLRAWR